MSSERQKWYRQRQALAPYGVVERVENVAGTGTPDMCYCFQGVTGWAELKHISRWPIRSSSVVRVPSLTTEQVFWLKNWARHGGIAWLLLTVARHWTFLLTPAQAQRLLQGETRVRHLRELEGGEGNAWGHRVADVAELVLRLKSNPNPSPKQPT